MQVAPAAHARCSPRRRRSRRRPGRAFAISAREVAVVVGARVHPLLADDAQPAVRSAATSDTARRGPSPSSALVAEQEHAARAELLASSAPPPRPARRRPARRARRCARRTGSTCRARPSPRPGTSFVSPTAVGRRAHLHEAGLVRDRERDRGRARVELADVGDRARVLDRLARVVGGPVRVPARRCRPPAVASSAEAKLTLKSPDLAARLLQRQLLGVDDALRLVGVRALERQAREDRERVARRPRRRGSGRSPQPARTATTAQRRMTTASRAFGGGSSQGAAAVRSGAILAGGPRSGPPAAGRLTAILPRREDRRAHRRRRLPRPERRDPRRDARRPRRRPRGRSACWRGYAGLAERSYVPLDMRTVSGILHARRDDPLDLELRPLPRTTDGVERVRRRGRGGRLRRRRRDRRRAHDGDHAPAARGPRPAAGRRAEDDRQRRSLHRLHVRLRHRGAGRDRRDRPPAHDRRSPTTG